MNDPGTRARSRTETFDATISGLLTKRADTFGEMMRLRDRLVAIEGDLVAMDRVLGALGYTGDLEAVPPRQMRDAPFGRGQVMRRILDCLREAGEPLTVRQIAERGFAHLGNRDEPVQLDNLSRRVSKALNRLRGDGAVRCARDGFGGAVWSLAAV